MPPEWLCKGRIIKCPFDYPKEHKKIAILLGRDYSKQELIFVLVNSEISKQTQKDVSLKKLQIAIRKENYSRVGILTKKVSYVDCARVRRKEYNELVGDFDREDAKDSGSCLSPDDWGLVYKAVLESDNLKERDRIYIKSVL